MSRIGNAPVVIPDGVDIKIDGHVITVKGPKGTLTRELHPDITAKQEDKEIIVTRPSDDKFHKAIHGTTRALIHNMVVGVSQGFEKKMEISGVGWRAQKKGNKLVMNLGYSHPVEMEDPEGIETKTDGPNTVIVSGIDKEAVGAYAALVRSKRPPEPYKGHGIKYADEHIRRKVGKTG
ncbi:MAG: 50S ribosomal protein L6 [Eubacteriaceae bacterium]|jgi:large subunit ribosomal protein L6|uniref:Large ribosomal subunit protein uL6 n=1 Tax=Candidatus Pseudoramibacter fermentans TaxID=2594427 RepID=A0A6L5GSK7_9FIRM|nr:50S ribosomal protein L6 [Candidatus Pseudoramibacter fermentans]RRF93108.1 MAG: 50S ribosomal protein L6 [Eubacteriaceae bacterium]